MGLISYFPYPSWFNPMHMYLAYLAQPLLVGQRGYVGAQSLESLIDALHASSLAKISRLSLLSHLGSALQASRLVTSPTTERERERRRDQLDQSHLVTAPTLTSSRCSPGRCWNHCYTHHHHRRSPSCARPRKSTRNWSSMRLWPEILRRSGAPWWPPDRNCPWKTCCQMLILLLFFFFILLANCATSGHLSA